MSRWLASWTMGWLLTIVATAFAQEPAFDLVIRHGRIVNGTGNPWFHGDLAIRGDRIVALGTIPEGVPARRSIDATGLVVAPGFVNAHSHSDWTLFEDGDAPSKVRQGVTTDVLGEDQSGGPNRGKRPAKVVTIRGTAVRIASLGDYLAAVERSGVAINVASYVGLGNVWGGVMGDSFDRPTAAHSTRWRRCSTRRCATAPGLSTMLAAPQEMVATTDDLVQLGRVVRHHGGSYASHVRGEGLEVIKAIGEAIEVGERAGVPVEITHLKIAETTLWGRMPEIIALIEAARRGGLTSGRTCIRTRGAITTWPRSSRPGRTKGAARRCSAG